MNKIKQFLEWLVMLTTFQFCFHSESDKNVLSNCATDVSGFIQIIRDTLERRFSTYEGWRKIPLYFQPGDNPNVVTIKFFYCSSCHLKSLRLALERCQLMTPFPEKAINCLLYWGMILTSQGFLDLKKNLNCWDKHCCTF